MRPEEAIAMLDLDDPLTPAPAAEVIREAVPGEKVAAKIDTVLELDNWSRRRGKELVRDSDELKEVTKLAEKLADRAAGVPQHAEEKYWETAAADFHAAAYEPAPEKGPGCTDKLRDDFMGALMETEEFQQIRASTVLNPMAAEVATLAFAKQFQQRREEEARAAAAPPPPAGKGKSKAGPAHDSEIATMKAAAKACAAALKGVREAADAADMCGLGDGGPGRKLDPNRVAAVQRRVRNSPRLKKIAELAGRFRRLAASKQRQKVGHGQDEVVGITVGAELARVIPAELAMLTDDEFFPDAARRLLEGQAMVRQVKATEPAGRGPIVVVVDESGSMSGNKIETAKGLALAMAWIAKKQRRWCCLVGFSGGKEGTYCLIPPGKPNEAALLDWLEHFYGGGTTMDVPLDVLPGKWPALVEQGLARGKTDMVVITDAEVQIPAEMKARFLAFKKAEQVRMTTLVVEGSPGDVGEVSDEVYTLPALTFEAEAVGRVLSV